MVNKVRHCHIVVSRLSAAFTPATSAKIKSAMLPVTATEISQPMDEDSAAKPMRKATPASAIAETGHDTCRSKIWDVMAPVRFEAGMSQAFRVSR